MRHQKKKITLDRPAASRRALLKHLAESLILYEKIVTTRAKGKAVQSAVERLVSTAKANTLSARRRLIKALYTPNTVNKLLEVLGPRYAERHGGYTRLTAIGQRRGDGAEEAVVEFV